MLVDELEGAGEEADGDLPVGASMAEEVDESAAVDVGTADDGSLPEELLPLPLLLPSPESEPLTKDAMAGPGKTYVKPGLYTY